MNSKLHHSILFGLALTSQALAQTAAPDPFQQLDKNSDGKLTQEEFPYPFFFKKHDKDGDGMLSQSETAEIKAVGGQTSTHSTSATPPTQLTAAPAATSDFHPRPHGDEATKAGLKPDVLAKLDIAMQQAVANKEVSGVIGLIHRQGQRGYFEAFGWQDIEAQKPLPKDALFRLQSMTKPIVAATALSLLDEGLFTLDEPISKHYPEWTEPKVLENGQLVPAKFAITPRMLMSHSSGLYYGDIQKGALSKAGNEGATFTPVATTNRSAKTTLKEFSEGLAKAPLKFHPGTGYQYGHSIDVLGRYIEAVAGKPLDVVMQERILGPLKMTSTDFWVHPENAGRICQIYTQPQPGVLRRGREASQLTEKPTLFLGGQGLISSTEDYERFCRMLMNRGELDGVRVLKAETVDIMFQNHLKPEIGQQYGLGGAVDGEGGYAWGGANGTQFWLDRTNQLFGIFMVQTQNYRAPTYNAFKQLANESAGIASKGSMGALGGGGGASAMTGQFKQRDTNNDGKLSRDELPAALFDRLDADKDGFVTEEELKALRRQN
jgi:CubicO group peptidase (beta-lactamase class C family)